MITKFKRYIARILLTIFSRWENKLWRYLYAKRETPRYDEFAKKINLADFIILGKSENINQKIKK